MIINRILLFIAVCLTTLSGFGQTKKLPQIDKPQYVNKYRLKGGFSRTALPERTARKMPSVIMLNGYLMVYNEDLGYFNNHPDEIISAINDQKMFGRDNWRIPTPDELSIMEDNAEKIGLGSAIYMCTTYANGVLRLVSTQGEYSNGVRIGNTWWADKNLGASSSKEHGRLVTYDEAVQFCPKGWRLPTIDDFNAMVNSGKACFGIEINLKDDCVLYFPYSYDKEEKYLQYSNSGQYWLQEDQNDTNGFSFDWEYTRSYRDGPMSSENIGYPKICHPSKGDKRCVRYVK